MFKTKTGTVQALEDENTKLNECLTSINLQKDEINSLNKLMEDWYNTKKQIFKCFIIIKTFKLHLKLLNKIPTEYEEYDPHLSSSSSSSSSSDSSSYEIDRSTGERFDPNRSRESDPLYQGWSRGGGYQKRHTKRHTKYKKRRHTKKRN